MEAIRIDCANGCGPFVYYCKDHGALCERCGFDYCSTCNLEYVPSIDRILENIKSNECMIEDLQCSIDAYLLDLRFKGILDTVKIIQLRLQGIKGLYNRIIEIPTAQLIYEIHMEVKDLRITIESSKAFNEVNKFLAQKRASIMNTEEGRDCMKQIKQMQKAKFDNFLIEETQNIKKAYEENLINKIGNSK